MNGLVLFICLLRSAIAGTVDADVGFDPHRLNLHSVVSRIRSLNSVPNGTIKTLELAARFTPNVKNESKPEFKQFFNFIARYQKSYGDNITLASKFNNFKTSIARINVLQRSQPKARFELNHFADYSPAEFVRTFTGTKIDETEEKEWKKVNEQNKTSDFEFRWKRDNGRFDWRDRGVVSEVKDQGRCGCCYAFATVDAVEAAYAIKTNRHVRASVQQVAACSRSRYCSGGIMSYTLDYIVKTGLTLEADYPYVSTYGAEPTCSYHTSPLTYIKSYRRLRGMESAIIDALKTYGPLPAAIDASDIQFYRSGVITRNNRRRINHAILIVGYGTDNGTPYWLVKNSWSPRWGESGYFRLERGRDTLYIESYVMAVVA